MSKRFWICIISHGFFVYANYGCLDMRITCRIKTDKPAGDYAAHITQWNYLSLEPNNKQQACQNFLTITSKDKKPSLGLISMSLLMINMRSQMIRVSPRLFQPFKRF